MRISDWSSDVCSSDLGEAGTRFGQRYVGFQHPDCGIDFEVIEDETDTRAPFASPYVPIEHAQRGFHSWTASVREIEDMDFFMHSCWHFEKIGEAGNRHRYTVKGSTEAGTTIHFLYEPDRRQGSWTTEAGIIHHGPFGVPDMDVQELGRASCGGREEQ